MLPTLCLHTVLASGWSGAALAQGSYFDWPLPWFIEQPRTVLFLSGEVDESSQSAIGSDRQQDRFQRELKLNIRTRGYVYHPALLIYGLGLRPEFRWLDMEAEGSKSSSDSVFLGYDIQTTWLKDKPYTVNLSAQRTRSEFSNLLAAKTTQENTAYAGTLQIKSDSVPTKITYQNSNNDAGGYYPSQTSDDRWQLNSIHEVNNRKTELNIEQVNYARTIGGTTSSSEQLRASLHNQYRIDDGGYLNSALRFVEGNRQDDNTTRAHIGSQLSLRHRHNLRSDYSATYSRRDDEDRFSRSTAYSAGLTHQLYENLTTSIRLSSSNNDTDVGEMNTDGGGVKVSYTRRIPWGRFRIYHGNRRDVRDDQREATLVSVRDQAYVFEGITTSIILEDVNIDTDSITLTDAAGLVVFVLGVDYEVDVLSSTTIITRSSFGGIAEGQTVVVDYLFAANPPAKTIRSSAGSGVQLSLGEFLSISYDVNRFDERVVEGTPPEFPLDSESRQFGAQLRLGRSITRLNLRELDSARNAQETRSLTETIRLQPVAAVSLDLSASYFDMELKDTGEISKGYGINAGLSWGFGRRGRLKASAFLQQSRSSLRQQERKGMTAEYRWRFGAWLSRIHLQLHDTANEFEDDTWSRRNLYFETSRRFN